jgi:phenylpropionate dioxygenase-like ring-hydroxylating dioxygenase large terminal subunit
MQLRCKLHWVDRLLHPLILAPQAATYDLRTHESMTHILPISEVTTSKASEQPSLPRECTFAESDWRALAPFWYPVAFSHEIKSKPYAATLLDERVVVYRLSDGSLAAARDICYHRGVPLSMGHVERDEIICRYHGLRYDRNGRCTCIPAHPKGSISPRCAYGDAG